jgi:hypothetical protein
MLSMVNSFASVSVSEGGHANPYANCPLPEEAVMELMGEVKFSRYYQHWMNGFIARAVATDPYSPTRSAAMIRNAMLETARGIPIFARAPGTSSSVTPSLASLLHPHLRLYYTTTLRLYYTLTLRLYFLSHLLHSYLYPQAIRVRIARTSTLLLAPSCSSQAQAAALGTATAGSITAGSGRRGMISSWVSRWDQQGRTHRSYSHGSGPKERSWWTATTAVLF